MSPLPSIHDLNELPAEEFVRQAAPLFEGAPRFLHRLAQARPFRSITDLFRSARSVAHDMSAPEQVELLNAHPRIGADPAAISNLSYGEQGYDHAPAQAAAETARRLHELNEAYEEHFGFRYVVFVAGRPRSEIVPTLEAALEADRSAELRRGLEDVVSIAEDRLGALGATRGRHPSISA